VLDPTQYPMAEIMTNTGQRVMVYTSGPFAGQDEDGNFPIQATDPASFTLGGDGGGGGGGGGGGNGDADGASTFTATDGRVFTNEAAFATYQASLNTQTTAARTAASAAAEAAARARGERQSAYDLLYSEFNKYGLGSLVTPLRDLITSGVSPSEFTIRLRETDAYKKRFVANEARIKNGLRALSEAEYIRDEDAYQEVMRRRGLPASYYEQTVDPVTGIAKQKGFEKLISGDVSSAELEDRIVAAQERVIRGAPQIAQALKEFYPEISNGDILAYALDPANAIDMIKRKVTAAEIGGAQLGAGLKATVSGAETLASAGVTGQRYQQAAPTIAEASIRGGQLASIYGEDPYTQQTAEQEVFNIAGAQEARKQRQKVTGLEKVTFGGKTGLTSGAFARDRAGEL
jgi:hypothetical protein